MVATDQETPLRTCPSCEEERRTRFERCPECGTSYFATPRSVVRRRRRIAIVVGAVLVAALVVLGVALSSDQSDRERRESARLDQVRAELRARLKRIQAPH